MITVVIIWLLHIRKYGRLDEAVRFNLFRIITSMLLLMRISALTALSDVVYVIKFTPGGPVHLDGCSFLTNLEKINLMRQERPVRIHHSFTCVSFILYPAYADRLLIKNTGAHRELSLHVAHPYENCS